jgi:hypothetical protein
MAVEIAPQYFNGAAQNIGLLLGDKFGSTDVDCDCPEAIMGARKLLPETGLIFGRRSKPFSHYLYRSDPAVYAGPSIAVRMRRMDLYVTCRA